jgi:hypothetical protein
LSARVAADAGSENKLEVTTMEFEQWATDIGLQLENMDEASVVGLKAREISEFLPIVGLEDWPAQAGLGCTAVELRFT